MAMTQQLSLACMEMATMNNRQYQRSNYYTNCHIYTWSTVKVGSGRHGDLLPNAISFHAAFIVV